MTRMFFNRTKSSAVMHSKTSTLSASIALPSSPPSSSVQRPATASTPQRGGNNNLAAPRDLRSGGPPSASSNLASRPYSTNSTPDRHKPADTIRSVTPSTLCATPQSFGSGEVTILPAQYEHADPVVLSRLVGSMLSELVALNDRLPLQDGQLTRFHSREAPAMTVSDYLQRIVLHAVIPPAILLSMIYYIDQLCLLCTSFSVSSLTVHRVLISAAAVASKGLTDSFWTNETYARVGGIGTKELGMLEMDLLKRLDWRIIPPEGRLEAYYEGLAERNEEFEIDEGTRTLASVIAAAAAAAGVARAAGGAAAAARGAAEPRYDEHDNNDDNDDDDDSGPGSGPGSGSNHDPDSDSNFTESDLDDEDGEDGEGEEDDNNDDEI